MLTLPKRLNSPPGFSGWYLQTVLADINTEAYTALHSK